MMLAAYSKVCFNGFSGVGNTSPQKPITIWAKPPTNRNSNVIATLTMSGDGAPYPYPELCDPAPIIMESRSALITNRIQATLTDRFGLLKS